MKRTLVLTAVALAALALVGVGLAATTLKIQADKTNKLAFNTKALTAKAGKVTIVMTNPSILPHNVAIRAGTSAKSKLIAKGKVVGKGGTSTVSAVLKAGKYRFVCTVPGHEAGGMWGILTVKP
jgi:plastocyanin